MRVAKLGGLRTHLAGGVDGDGGGDGPLVVLMHGFGAPGDDLVGLLPVLRVAREVRFAFPEAPLSLADFPFPARAWWPLDLARLEQARTRGQSLDRAGEVPEGLVLARQHVIALLDDLQAQLGVSSERILLGGFSQGSMLAIDVALSDLRPLAGLVLLSTTLINADEWRARLPARAGLPIFQSHGRRDPLLPFAAAEHVRQLWQGIGSPVTWTEFDGGHELTPQVLQRLCRFIEERLGSAHCTDSR
ncbi:MAG TPA: hypothetical protein VF331_11480 [Polyangiales bacterium]